MEVHNYIFHKISTSKWKCICIIHSDGKEKIYKTFGKTKIEAQRNIFDLISENSIEKIINSPLPKVNKKWSETWSEEVDDTKLQFRNDEQQATMLMFLNEQLEAYNKIRDDILSRKKVEK